ncbi:Rho-type gtpase-activating protein [Malassezia equina]|uniref:Rho-type gtpase-activating protein n=1 Tax=Malassezia equina TaxID=1381935 RepID=A0AAF0IY87_9BASI|nr:Rho-type gtpase-activating protein [Malassezia equina]
MPITSNVFSRINGVIHCQDCQQSTADSLSPSEPPVRAASAPSSPKLPSSDNDHREFESFDLHESLASPLLDSNEPRARHKRSHTVSGAVPDTRTFDVEDTPVQTLEDVISKEMIEAHVSPKESAISLEGKDDLPTSPTELPALPSKPTEEHRDSSSDSAFCAETQHRLSDAIHSEILQAYSSNSPGYETPVQRQHRSVSSTLQDLWNRPGSVSESEILKNLSLYDSEFEALIATPDFARRNEQSWPFRSSSALSTSLPMNSNDTSPLLDGDSTQSGPTPETWTAQSREAAKGQILDEITQLEIQRHVALAELLGVQSINEHMPAHATSVHARVDKALESLRAHLDTVKAEYRKELESLAIMQQSLRQELRPMLHVRSTLIHESQQLAQHVDELTTQVAQLETRARSANLSKQHLAAHAQPMTSTPPAPSGATMAPLGQTLDALSPSTSSGTVQHHEPVAMVERASPVTQTAPISKNVSIPATSLPTTSPQSSNVSSFPQTNAAPSASRLEQSLPPLPPPRKFRWMKPKLLTPELAALGETLLLPAHELARGKAIPTISPPVPPKDASSMARAPEPGTSPMGLKQTPSTIVPGQHHQRMPSIPNCVPSPPGTSMIGRPLTKQVQLEGGTLVPRLVDWCIVAVETNGLQDEGLYRKSGSTYAQRQLVQLFDSGKAFDLCDTREFHDVAVITGVLKSYLRKLPDPLISYDVYSQFMELGEHLTQSPVAVASMQALLEGLQPVHLATLKRVCLHLKVVHQYQLQTRMNARNLGLVFGPTLMRAPEPTLELLETPRYARIVGCTSNHTHATVLIEHASVLFVD